MERQSRYLLKYLENDAGRGCDIRNDVVRIWQWFVSDYPTPQEFEQGNTWPRISITPYLEVRNEFISEPRPASTGMAVRQLPIRNTRVEVDMICIDDGNKSIGYAVPDGYQVRWQAIHPQFDAEIGFFLLEKFRSIGRATT